MADKLIEGLSPFEQDMWAMMEGIAVIRVSGPYSSTCILYRGEHKGEHTAPRATEAFKFALIKLYNAEGVGPDAGNR